MTYIGYLKSKIFAHISYAIRRFFMLIHDHGIRIWDRGGEVQSKFMIFVGKSMVRIGYRHIEYGSESDYLRYMYPHIYRQFKESGRL